MKTSSKIYYKLVFTWSTFYNKEKPYQSVPTIKTFNKIYDKIITQTVIIIKTKKNTTYQHCWLKYIYKSR